MKIELLFFEGCPNHEPAERLLREVIAAMDVDAEIILIDVLNNDDAIAKKFLGSPSIRIDGSDLELEEDESTLYSMRCRVYRGEKGLSGIPPAHLIRDALLKAMKRSRIEPVANRRITDHH